MVLDWRFFLVYIVLYHFYEMIVYDRYTIESLLVQAFVVFMVFPRSKYLIQKKLQFMHLYFEFLLYGQVVSSHWTRTLKWGGGGWQKSIYLWNIRDQSKNTHDFNQFKIVLYTLASEEDESFRPRRSVV